MPTSSFLRRCRKIADMSGGTASGFGSGHPGSGSGALSPSEGQQPEMSDADSLIGFFQLFRPDGNLPNDLFDGIVGGEELARRLARVYQTASDDRRPQGGKDAFFIVRSPAPLAPETAEQLGKDWIAGLRDIAGVVGDERLANLLSENVNIRVLEGIAPKHPKQPEERSSLLTAILEGGKGMTAKIQGVDPHAELLRSAYYFVACDAMLRDYLMWPFYSGPTGLADPLASYFTLWTHGVKYRIFREDLIDLYLPPAAVIDAAASPRLN